MPYDEEYNQLHRRFTCIRSPWRRVEGSLARMEANRRLIAYLDDISSPIVVLEMVPPGTMIDHVRDLCHNFQFQR